VLTWPDRALNHEQALVQTSADRGLTWSAPVNAAQAGDRPDNPAVAISPTGTDVYLVYNAADRLPARLRERRHLQRLLLRPTP
jgi:hypothetical protein